GALHIDDPGLVAIEAIALAADVHVHQFAGQGGGHVEAAGDVAVLSVLMDLAVGAGAGGGQWHALANLDQRRVALGGLNLLRAAAAAAGAAADDADLVTPTDLAAADLDFAGAAAEGAVD